MTARRALLLLLLILGAGCSRRSATTQGPVTFPPSPFLRSLDWDDVLFGNARVADRRWTWDWHEQHGTDPVVTPDHHLLRQGYEAVGHCEDPDQKGRRVECRPEDVRAFMDAAKEDLKKRLAAGASELSSQHGDDGSSCDFEIDYTMGNTSGRITGKALYPRWWRDDAVRVTFRLEEKVAPVR